MKTQIPIYRAKKINSDEYVEGYLVENEIIIQEFSPEYTMEYHDGLYFYVNPSTLAIHFDKLAKDRKTKVFFSLSEDGKGGDIINYNGNFYIAKWNSKSDKLEFVEFNHEYNVLNTMANVKVTGIQE